MNGSPLTPSLRTKLKTLDVPKHDQKFYFTRGWQCRLLVMIVQLQQNDGLDLSDVFARLRDDPSVDVADPDAYYMALLQQAVQRLSELELVSETALASVVRSLSNSSQLLQGQNVHR